VKRGLLRRIITLWSLISIPLAVHPIIPLRIFASFKNPSEENAPLRYKDPICSGNCDISLENNTDTLALHISLRKEEIMLDIDIGSRGLEQLLVFVSPKDCSDSQLQLGFGKTRKFSNLGDQ
jgi:hypothetical protein